MNQPLTVLQKQFGYDSFRPNQEEIIHEILEGKDVFASMPTGGGKSICYQIPALCLEGLTIVISPLIALMKDQVDAARETGIPAAYINSALKADEASSVYARLYGGEIKLLYISPERLALDGYLEKLGELPIRFFAIDEAHCLSEWGHDFRPDYLVLSRVREAFPDVPIAAFTATATKRVQKDIIRILKLDSPFLVRASFNRKELFYRVDRKGKGPEADNSFYHGPHRTGGYRLQDQPERCGKNSRPPRQPGNQCPPLSCGSVSGGPGRKPGSGSTGMRRM